MKKAVFSAFPDPSQLLSLRATVGLLIVMTLLAGCSNSRSTLASLTPPSADPAPRATPRARSESAGFSKNFFSAFPLVRLQFSRNVKGEATEAETLEFLFDTGNAGLSVLDVNVAQRLGLSLVPAGSVNFAGVTLPTLRARADRVQLFNDHRKERRLQLNDVSFQVVDLTAFAELAGRRVDGILGYDVIRHFVTTVDYQQQKVIFGNQTITRQPATSPTVPLVTTPGSVAGNQNNRPVVPFELRNGWIVVKTQLNGSTPEEMILDTGASITTFSQDQASALALDVSQARPTTLILPIGRLTYLPHRLREIEFGGLKLTDTASVVVSTREGLFTSGTGMSLLGANVLRHFRLTIDYGRRQLTLERNAGVASDPDEYTSIGVLPMLRDGRFYVSGVVNGSPADEEGIEAGDEIIGLAGKGIDEYSFGEMVDALRGPDNSSLDIIVRRGQRTIELRLKRVRLL